MPGPAGGPPSSSGAPVERSAPRDRPPRRRAPRWPRSRGVGRWTPPWASRRSRASSWRHARAASTPACLLWVLRHEQMTVDELEDALDRRSGLLGLSGCVGGSPPGPRRRRPGRRACRSWPSASTSTGCVPGSPPWWRPWAGSTGWCSPVAPVRGRPGCAGRPARGLGFLGIELDEQRNDGWPEGRWPTDWSHAPAPPPPCSSSTPERISRSPARSGRFCPVRRSPSSSGKRVNQTRTRFNSSNVVSPSLTLAKASWRRVCIPSRWRPGRWPRPEHAARRASGARRPSP